MEKTGKLETRASRDSRIKEIITPILSNMSSIFKTEHDKLNEGVHTYTKAVKEMASLQIREDQVKVEQTKAVHK